MTKKRKLWIPIVIVLAVIAIAVAALFVWRSKNSGSVDVYAVSDLYYSYWGDSTQLDGVVSAGKAQTVTLQSGLLESVNVSEGDQVEKGDVLMVYDTTSFQLTLQSDQARIALLESQVDQANRELKNYKSLRPSEEAPQPTEEIIDHGPLALVSAITSADFTGGDMVFLCSADTTVSADFLRQLRDTPSASAEFDLYEDNVLYGSWYVAGGDESLQSYTLEFETDVTITLPGEDATDPGTDGDSSADTSQEPAEAEDQTITQRVPVSTVIDPIQDWVLGDGLYFTGDGVALTAGSTCFGQLVSCTPMEYEQYESVYTDGYIPDGSDNYLYSKAELASMIKETEASLADLELSLKSAKLTYQQDQLVGKTGQVVASVSGIVTDLKDPTTLSTGEELMTIKGSENYSVTAYVGEMNLSLIDIGDTLTVYTYSTGNYVTATITEIGDTPEDSTSYGWGNENPNNSYYPVTAVVDDPDAELRIGEWCEVTLDTESDSSSFYLPVMYVRSDSRGSYVMLADENGKLKQQYVNTGKSLWGYYIEIKSGVSEDDRIAFPYGTSVKEGATVVDASYMDW